MSARPGVAQRSHKPRPRSNLEWQAHAKCTDTDPRIFFTPARYDEALAVCHGCPVQMACRQYGHRQAGGVWGARVMEGKY